MSIPAFPLSWPTGWKRTAPAQRRSDKFGRAGRAKPGGEGGWIPARALTISEATERIRRELRGMGAVDGDFVISTNVELRLDGFPRSDRRPPEDPGVAVYWVRASDQGRKVMAIDCYDTVAGNLGAVAASLAALRSLERHGGATILDRAFTGFVALPASAGRAWWTVLGLDGPNVSRAMAEVAYRRRRGETHPDRSGGSADAFREVQSAWDEAQRVIS